MSPLDCGRFKGELDYKVLLFILLLTVGPILLRHIATLILSIAGRKLRLQIFPLAQHLEWDPKQIQTN